ncbi:hypothetical protein BU15DRAFT_65559 [Melanogaster broomeanus]|nr:hypothetical protein BU15DRAFT_65559 [Melanogaster broomeanus]
MFRLFMVGNPFRRSSKPVHKGQGRPPSSNTPEGWPELGNMGSDKELGGRALDEVSASRLRHVVVLTVGLPTTLIPYDIILRDPVEGSPSGADGGIYSATYNCDREKRVGLRPERDGGVTADSAHGHGSHVELAGRVLHMPPPLARREFCNLSENYAAVLSVFFHPRQASRQGWLHLMQHVNMMVLELSASVVGAIASRGWVQLLGGNCENGHSSSHLCPSIGVHFEAVHEDREGPRRQPLLFLIYKVSKFTKLHKHYTYALGACGKWLWHFSWGFLGGSVLQSLFIMLRGHYGTP